MLAYSSSFNTGRTGSAHYNLARLQTMRQSLLTGYLSGFPITISSETASMREACDIVRCAIMGNANDKKEVRNIEGVEPATMGERLDDLATTVAHVVVDGNTRALAVVLHYAISGEWLNVMTVTSESAPEVLSLKSNIAQGLAVAASWQARTIGVARLVREAGTKGLTRDEVCKLFGLKVGLAQHALTSAQAIAKHGLLIESCVSLTASQWRDVRDAGSKEEAEALAYNKVGLVRAWSPSIEARKALESGLFGDEYEAILKVLATGDADAFHDLIGQ